jgi:hypothetical protein
MPVLVIPGDIDLRAGWLEAVIGSGIVMQFTEGEPARNMYPG